MLNVDMGEEPTSSVAPILPDDRATFPLASSSTKTPSPSQAKTVSSMNKRQQAAQKARMVAVCIG